MRGGSTYPPPLQLTCFWIRSRAPSHPPPPKAGSIIGWITHTGPSGPAPARSDPFGGLSTGLLFPFAGATGAFSYNWYSPRTPLTASTPQTRTDVLWPSGGAVGATAGGSGVMDPQVSGVPGVLSRSVVDWLPGVLDTIIDWGGSSSSRRSPAPTPEVEAVAIDWGGLIGGIAETYIGARYAPTPQFSGFVEPGLPVPAPQGSVTSEGVTWGAGGGGGMAGNGGELCGAGPCGSPRYLTYDCRTGTFSKKRRRRRGRLLTASDQHDLGVIVAMFGKGAAGQIALAAAVKR